MKKEHDIIILPSENPSPIFRHKKEKRLGYWFNGDKPHHAEFQNLYILSDEEVTNGDWAYHINGFVFKCTSDDGNHLGTGQNLPYGFVLKESCKKIIGTTNSELYLNKIVKEDMHMYKESLPQISQDLIKSYVENPFDKVMVEYEEFYSFEVGDRVTVKSERELFGVSKGQKLTVKSFAGDLIHYEEDEHGQGIHFGHLEEGEESIFEPLVNPDGTLAASLFEEKSYTQEDLVNAIVNFSNDFLKVRNRVSKSEVIKWIRKKDDTK